MVTSDTLLNFLLDVDELLETFAEFTTIRAFIAGEIILNPAWAFLPLDAGERLEVLRKLTGFTVALEVDFNCYPRGLALTTCFDTDGNPIP